MPINELTRISVGADLSAFGECSAMPMKKVNFITAPKKDQHTMPANHIHHLQCVLCRTTYNQAEIAYTCPTCGPLGVLEVHYDYEQVAQLLSRAQLAQERDPTIWRYRALVPISYSQKDLPPLAVGGTPLYPVKRLRAYLGMRGLWLKDDTRNPSASLKDRASVIAVVLSQGKTVACAST